MLTALCACGGQSEPTVSGFRCVDDAGFGPGYPVLGGLYYYGRGVEQDYGKAFEYFRKGAEADGASSYNWLGSMYYNGEGVEKDPEKALQCYLKAENIYLGSNKSNNERVVSMLKKYDGTQSAAHGCTRKNACTEIYSLFIDLKCRFSYTMSRIFPNKKELGRK